MSGIINTTTVQSTTVESTNLQVSNIKDSTGTNTALTIASNGGVSGIATTLTEQATTSGTTKDFTVPSTAKVIYVSLLGFSFSGNNDTVMIQLGDSGGIETSGYTASVAYTGGGHTNNGDTYNSNTTNNGFFIYFSGAASGIFYGHATIVNAGGNKFTYASQITNSSYISNSAGYKELSSGITTVRLTTVNGRTFDSGAVNVTYIE